MYVCVYDPTGIKNRGLETDTEIESLSSDIENADSDTDMSACSSEEFSSSSDESNSGRSYLSIWHSLNTAPCFTWCEIAV